MENGGGLITLAGMSKLAIVTENLTRVFWPARGWRRTEREKPITAVSRVSLSIPRGELFGLLGPNGAGKTTLVKMLCTLILPTAGTATVAGHPLTQAGHIRSSVGLVVSDERSFFWRLSARRNLAFFAALYGLYGRVAQRRIEQVLADVDLLAVAERPFRQFSSGMRQRLAIARGLLHQPQILFLDEPSRSLDPVATQQLHNLIRRLMAEREMTIFLITHDLTEAEKLCDRVALMHRGEIQATGSPAALRARLRPYRQYTIETDNAIRLKTAVENARRETRLPPLHCSDCTLTFQANEDAGELTAVLDHLRQHQLVIRHITSHLPTLEEVFTHYTSQP